MENNRFFIWITRINSLVFLLILLLSAVYLIKDAIRSPDPATGAKVITNVAPDPKGEEKWVLGRYGYAQQAGYMMLPLISDNQSLDTSSDPGFGRAQYRMYELIRAKNILFINTQTNEARWLFKDNAQLVIGFWEAPSNYGRLENPAKARAIFYKVISTDTNGDGILNYKDRKSLAISRPDGGGYRVIIEELDDLVGESAINEEKILVVHQSAGVGYSSLIDLNTLAVLSSKELPKVESQ